MNDLRIVIAYTGTQSGNRLISRRIAEKLGEHGWPAEAVPVKRIAKLECDAVLIGSSLSCGLWSRSGVQFVRQHRTWLADHPNWIFSVAPIGEEPDLCSAEILGIKRAIRSRGHHVFQSPADFGLLTYWDRMSLNMSVDRWVKSLSKELRQLFPPAIERRAA